MGRPEKAPPATLRSLRGDLPAEKCHDEILLVQMRRSGATQAPPEALRALRGDVHAEGGVDEVLLARVLGQRVGGLP